ncbi:MAG TPA: FtsX-like permease family protein [Rhodanobacteraceae bacterium]|nr:FtsX-like permease family protein [Rhodanobacteraceae bacterium]
MSFRMMLSMLRRRPMMPLLVLLQVAVACAILCNVLFLGWQKLKPMLAPSGMDTNNLIFVGGLSRAHGEWSSAEVEAGAQALQEVPGVRAASAAIGLPMEGILDVVALRGPTGVKVGVDVYAGYDLAKTLGIDIVNGRNFLPGEYPAPSEGQGNGVITPIIITESLAHQLFGNTNPLGGLVRDADVKVGGSYQVVGVTRHLIGTQMTRSHPDNSIVEPQRIGKMPFLNYAIRVTPHMHRSALLGVRKALQREFGALLPVGSEPTAEFYDTLRGNTFAARRGALWMLIAVVIIVLIVTLIGVIGLTGFWIQQRTHTIGILRAVGARRIDILTYFQGENAFVVIIAALCGMLLAYAGNLMLMRYYAVMRLPLWYLPVGAAVMLVLGQLAALSPALRASRVEPVAATRNI